MGLSLSVDVSWGGGALGGTVRTMAGGDLKCHPASASSSGPFSGVRRELDSWVRGTREGFLAALSSWGRDAVGLVRLARGRCLWRGEAEALSLRTSASGAATAGLGLHLPAPRGHFFAKQMLSWRFGQGHGWLVSLRPSSQPLQLSL